MSTTATEEPAAPPACEARGTRRSTRTRTSGPAGGHTLALRIDPTNPDHHLWNNNGTWWCHFSTHGPDYTTRRHRFSLKTRDRTEARLKRDRLFACLHVSLGGC